MTVTGGEEADGTLWKLQYKGGEVMWHEEGETTWLDEATRTYWQVDGELGQAGVCHERVNPFARCARTNLDEWLVRCTTGAPSKHLGNLTPGSIYESSMEIPKAA